MRRALLQKIGGVVDERFIFTVKSDNTGTSSNDQFTIPTAETGFNYDVETSDGYTATGLTGDHTITFPSGAGTYDVYISGNFPYMYFNNGGDRFKMLDISNFGIYALGSTSQSNAFRGCSNMTITATDSGNFENVNNFNATWRDCSSLTSFPLIDTSSVTSFSTAWYGCSSLTSFPLLDTSSGTNFNTAWYNCSSLTSFPLINTMNATRFDNTWQNCSSLASFPLLNTSNCTFFGAAWQNCSSLTSFPLIDTSSGTNFFRTWRLCSSLTSFPLLDTSSGTNFGDTWQNCSSLANYPANAFDTNIATNYSDAFASTNLTTQSIDDILVSLDTSGVSSGTFLQSGGSAPSATGEAAIDALTGRGWTITVTGGYSVPFLLDTYTGASVAYSLRVLSSSFINSPIIRVKRTTPDTTESDFKAFEITDGTLATFIGAGNGIISTWYDQSGNGNNATGTSNALSIASGGTIYTSGSLPSLYSPSSLATFLTITTPVQLKHVFTVHQSLSFDDSLHVILGDSTINGGLWAGGTFGGVDGIGMGDGSNPSIYSGIEDTTQHITNAFYDASAILRVDGVQEATGLANSITIDQIAKRNTGTFGLNGYIQEVIIYPTTQTANEVDIETEINGHYTVY